jgi:tRNA (Thr-GGU) A37 N-methylase
MSIIIALLGTPVIDIKPYVPAFDSFPEARAGI